MQHFASNIPEQHFDFLLIREFGDNALAKCEDLYIESGDHENLIHVTRASFMELMGGQEHATISYADN